MTTDTQTRLREIEDGTKRGMFRQCDNEFLLQLITELRAENEKMREGEKWAAEMFCTIMATAIGGFADSAVVAHQPMGAEHALAAVKQCAEYAKQLRAENEKIKRPCPLCGARSEYSHCSECLRLFKTEYYSPESGDPCP